MHTCASTTRVALITILTGALNRLVLLMTSPFCFAEKRMLRGVTLNTTSYMRTIPTDSSTKLDSFENN